jgi:hypothetical protein
MANIKDLTTIMEQHGVRSQLNAHDAQMYGSFLLRDTNCALCRLMNRTANMAHWYTSRHLQTCKLQLNVNKAEFI